MGLENVRASFASALIFRYIDRCWHVYVASATEHTRTPGDDISINGLPIAIPRPTTTTTTTTTTCMYFFFFYLLLLRLIIVGTPQCAQLCTYKWANAHVPWYIVLEEGKNGSDAGFKRTYKIGTSDLSPGVASMGTFSRTWRNLISRQSTKRGQMKLLFRFLLLSTYPSTLLYCTTFYFFFYIYYCSCIDSLEKCLTVQYTRGLHGAATASVSEVGSSSSS